ncbi:MAG: zinc ribbon domain-containing protein [Phycisphaeraceae bacterium]|nr:zinc ribbon domain-containing protein [Phycisphaeraceae bacterium]
MKQTPHCPACAAPLPELEAQQIVTCDFCGTDVNAEYQPAPAPALRSPPLSDEREYDDADDPPEDWQAGPWVHALLTSDRDEALALAESGNGRLTGEDLMLWSPALADALIKAERDADAEWARHLIVFLHGGARRRADDGIKEDSPEARAAREGRRMRAGDFRAAQRVQPKDAWFFLQIADRLIREIPESSGGMIVLTSAGPAGLRRFLELAAEFDTAGDQERLDDALVCVRRILTETTDDWAFGVVFDVATYLLPTLPTRTRQAVIDTLGDLADQSIDEPGREYGREWRGPDDMLTVLLLYADDLLHDHPDLGKRMLDAVVEGSSRHPFERYRWGLALRAVPSAKGRAACLDAYEQVYQQRAEDTEQDLLDEMWRKRRGEGLKPILKGGLPAMPQTARARDGQAPCPSCGHPLQLQTERLITTCDHCGQNSRVAREVRTIRRVLNPESLDLHTWEPERLVSTMLETQDDALRLAIANELASATSDGERFIELAPALVRYMLAEHIPDDVERLLADGIESMLRFRDPAFLDALFDSIRAQAFTEEGSDRLLDALEKAGPPAAPLLFDLCDKVTADADAWNMYTLRASQVGMTVIQRWAERDREGACEFLLDRMETTGPALSDQLPTYLGLHAFEDRPLGRVQERLIRFIDHHTDPAKVDWHKGISPLGKDLATPHLSWSAQDIADAEQRTGTKWGQGDGLAMQRLLADIPAVPGRLVTLRQVQMLFMQVDSTWGPPRKTGDLLARLDLARELLHDSTRVLILKAITQPPTGLTESATQEALRRLERVPTGEHVDPWKSLVATALTAEPDRTPAAIEKRRSTHFTPARGKLRWKLAKARHALGALVGRILRR